MFDARALWRDCLHFSPSNRCTWRFEWRTYQTHTPNRYFQSKHTKSPNTLTTDETNVRARTQYTILQETTVADAAFVEPAMHETRLITMSGNAFLLLSISVHDRTNTTNYTPGTKPIHLSELFAFRAVIFCSRICFSCGARGSSVFSIYSNFHWTWVWNMISFYEYSRVRSATVAARRRRAEHRNVAANAHRERLIKVSRRDKLRNNI